MAELDRETAAYLFEHIEIAVTKSRIHPRQHKGDVVFCGYADFQVSFDGVPFLQLCGNPIKLMGNQIRFDPKSEKGTGDRAGSHFPCWFPMTAEARAVITEKLKRSSEIVAMCDAAVHELRGETSEALPDANPFNA